MRSVLLRTARALLPIAVCVVFSMLESNLASMEDNEKTTEPSSSSPPTPVTSTMKPVTSPPFSEDSAYFNTLPTPPEKYFPNDTLLGKPVNCSKEEKECLRYNRIYVRERGKCYPLGDGPEHCQLAVDRNELEKRSGHIRGVCYPTDLCHPYSKNFVRMAYDGSCVERRKLNTACGKEPMNLIQHFFGDFECVRPQSISPPVPVYVSQPEEEGGCVFPNLRHDLSSIRNQESRVLFKECSHSQSVCFAKKQVWCENVSSCCDLLQKGPCSGGQWVVLNRTAWQEGDVRAACVPVHPCGSDSRLMAFDRKCHDAATVLRALCPAGVLLPNAFGEMSCVTRDFYRHVIDLSSNRPEFCELAHSLTYDDVPSGVRLVPECGLAENGNCIDAF